jgi:site-specific DNA-methyltransferase (adenine-specific)
MELNKIHHESALDTMVRMPDAFVDLIVTDCPYKIVAGGITVENLGGVFKTTSDGTNCSNKWLKADASRPSAVKDGAMFAHNDIKFHEWLPECYRVLKPSTHAYVMINGRNLKDLQIEAEKVGFVYQNLLVWKKNNATPNKYFMQNGEFILMLSKRPARSVNNLGEQTVFEIPNYIGNKYHPSEKPVELMKRFIEASSNVGDLVYDPFMGSGAVAKACIELDRDWLGSEIDGEYVDVANRTIESYEPQSSLFFT